jgi:hypothetical protein
MTVLAALGLFLIPSLFPGFLLYGVLGSVIAQLWLAATGIVMLRRARVAVTLPRPQKGASTTADDVEASSTAASRSPSRPGSPSAADTSVSATPGAGSPYSIQALSARLVSGRGYA